MKRALALAFAAGACIAIPQDPAPACTSNADCDTALGEVCNQGACYGGPPAGTFAAVVTPPSDRSDLITVEFPSFALPAGGDLGMLELEPPVHISGRVEAFCAMPDTCANTSIGATVVITRAPLYPGGTGFSAVVSSKGGLPRGSNSFSVAVPRTQPDDPDYLVTIVPEGNGALPPANGAASPAELAPPARLHVRATADHDTGPLVLGSAGSQVITGNLSDGASHALLRYRVVARGRLEAGGAITDVSTIDYTATGAFSLTLADGAVGPIAISATPYDSNVVAPSLLLGGLEPHSATRTIAQPPNIGNKVTVTIPIEGLSGDGAVKPVAGAHVTVTAVYDPILHTNASAVLSRETTTGADGTAQLWLLDGPTFATSYVLRVVPPSGSDLGVIYDQPFALDNVTAVRLPPRVALRGRVLDTAGDPVGQISVTARPSQRFTWSEIDDAAAFLAEIPAPTAVTAVAGDFVLYVDPAVAGVWAHYDLAFEAPAGSAIASWTEPDVEIPREGGLTALRLPDQRLPSAARFHGIVTDPYHLHVNGGELRIFAVTTDSSLCGQVPYPPATCVIPAQLLGHAASGVDGALSVALPR